MTERGAEWKGAPRYRGGSGKAGERRAACRPTAPRRRLLAHRGRCGILSGMPYLRVDKWMRVGAGLGLGLLLAAQGKVWPWLLVPLERCDPEFVGPPAEAVANEGSASRPHDERPADKRRKGLPLLLPDNAPAPRWPVHSLARRAGGARDGVVSCGPRRPSMGRGDGLIVAADPLAWHALLDPLERVWTARPAAGRVPPGDPAVRFCIRPTGPPGA